MNDLFQQRVRAAAVAGWWTLLVAISFSASVWIVFLVIMSARPVWFQSLLGPGVSWEFAQSVGFWVFSIFKVCLWLSALVVVWLTQWANQLEKRSR
jgi:hypothetical protein